MKLILSILLLLFSLRNEGQQMSPEEYREDLEFFLNTIETNYAFWDKKQTDWVEVKRIYLPAADTLTGKPGFTGLLEKIFYELYDHHASLNTNTMESQRLVPSGTDIWAAYINGKPVILQVRPGSPADAIGLRPGMEVLKFNGKVVDDAIKPFIGRTLKKMDIEARNYALRTLLAGKHSETRTVTVKDKNGEKEFTPLSKNLQEDNSPLSSRLLQNNTGYIRFNDRLWDDQTIPFFDSVLQLYKNTSALILDLRNTASGGNSTVARAILGSFISKEGFYQKHELVGEEKESGIKRSWMEIVSPRTFIYKKPLVILVDHWTGSMGEGIAIGFDGLKRATVIGTEMAGLNGANYSFKLPHSGIGFSFPSEKLYHVNGIAREKFRPAILVDPASSKASEDLILAEGIQFLEKKGKPATRR